MGEAGTIAARVTSGRRTAGISIAIAIIAGLLVSAFVFAPRSCAGGFDLYFWSGVAALVILAILPLVLHLGGSTLGSIGWSFGLLLVGAATWVVGLAAANFQLLCRLF